MDSLSVQKPIVILCLDEPLAQDVAKALPEDAYDVRITQSKLSRRAGGLEADAYEAQKIVDANQTRPGFVICDESTASSLSGASVTMGAGRRGWHTVLRSGSNKSNLAIAADRYLSGEFNGDRNVDEIVRFIKERTDENGMAISKDRLPGMLPFETALQEYEDKTTSSDRYADERLSPSTTHMLRGMIRSLVVDMHNGNHAELKLRMEDPAKARSTAQAAVSDMINYLRNPDQDLRMLTAKNLERLASENKLLTGAEELAASFREDPQAFHERAIEEVRRREIVGDEPPGATEAFIEHVKKEYPGFRLPSEMENTAVSNAIREIERSAQRAGKGWAKREGD